MNETMTKPPPRAVQVAMKQIGENLHLWRQISHVSREVVAMRAGVSVATVRRLENGQGATLENLLRIARTVPIMDELVASTDPYEYSRGRALATSAFLKD